MRQGSITELAAHRSSELERITTDLQDLIGRLHYCDVLRIDRECIMCITISTDSESFSEDTQSKRASCNWKIITVEHRDRKPCCSEGMILIGKSSL